MLILVYGEEDFLVFQKRKELEREFKRKNPKAGVEFFDSEKKVDFKKIKETLQAQPLFSLKRLFVFKNFLKNSLKETLEILKAYQKNSEIFLVFEEHHSQIKKEVLKNFSYKFFYQKLFWPQIYYWMKDYARRFNKTLSLSAAKLLFETYYNNLWFLSKEIEKLALISFKEIGSYEVKKFLKPIFLTKELFLLTEKFFLNDKKSFVFLLEKILQTSKTAQEIFYFLKNQTKNLFKVKFLKEKNSFHPFYFEKLNRLAKIIKEKDLAQIYQKLIYEEVLIKEGVSSYKEALKNLIISL